MQDRRVLGLVRYMRGSLPGGGSRDPAHMMDHLLRVYRIGMRIGREEGANLAILGPALLLHDAIRSTDEKEERKHALLSAGFAGRKLPLFGYSSMEIRKITNAMASHSRSDRRGGKKNLEAMVLYDADKIDGLGEDGVRRARALCRARGYDRRRAAEWYLMRILDVFKNEPPYTSEGRRIANKKIGVSLRYCRKTLGKDYLTIVRKEAGSSKIRM